MSTNFCFGLGYITYNYTDSESKLLTNVIILQQLYHVWLIIKGFLFQPK